MASLKRPTIPVWAINQLARQRPDTIDDLIKTHRSLARAKDPQKLRNLSRHRRELVGALTDQARDLLIDAGHAPSRQTIDRISSTLLATSSPEEEDLLKKGRLERELTPGGFEEAFTDLPAFEDVGDAASTEAKERAKKEMRDLATEAREAKDKARALSRDAARIRRDADAIDNEARRWTRRAEQLEKKIKDLEG
ncbi:MAG: hypothetical protein ACRDKB_08305 [Actinomycetota bacterium]